MNVDALVAATERAVRCRGTVMLSAAGDKRRWCAVCAAADGSIELRVGEPSRRWRRSRPADGESWLRDHGFVHVIDAWAAPVAHGTEPRVCAELLLSALREGLGGPDDGELVEVLTHPGVIGDTEVPAPSAPHLEHVRYALMVLADRGRGKVSIQGGRPAATWAWVFAADGTLELSPEPIRDQDDYSHDWTVSLQGSDLDSVAERLTALFYEAPDRSPSDPLFVTFIDL